MPDEVRIVALDKIALAHHADFVEDASVQQHNASRQIVNTLLILRVLTICDSLYHDLLHVVLRLPHCRPENPNFVFANFRDGYKKGGDLRSDRTALALAFAMTSIEAWLF
ncbi:hypothetical protein [Mangrovitalea sediminis]|uniref:hypothetical protein n=1 Tax=Mangrovitalea sediminis TaxID=1982043 RepID=UPI000BE51590|nr:hypothetical protein [Mangrovitalea sediminis]